MGGTAKTSVNGRQRQVLRRSLTLCLLKSQSLKNKRQDLYLILKLQAKPPADLQDESTAELENDLRNIEKINIKVRAKH